MTSYLYWLMGWSTETPDPLEGSTAEAADPVSGSTETSDPKIVEEKPDSEKESVVEAALAEETVLPNTPPSALFIPPSHSELTSFSQSESTSIFRSDFPLISTPPLFFSLNYSTPIPQNPDFWQLFHGNENTGTFIPSITQSRRGPLERGVYRVHSKMSPDVTTSSRTSIGKSARKRSPEFIRKSNCQKRAHL